MQHLLALLKSSEMQNMPLHMKEAFHSMWGIGNKKITSYPYFLLRLIVLALQGRVRVPVTGWLYSKIDERPDPPTDILTLERPGSVST